MKNRFLQRFSAFRTINENIKNAKCFLKRNIQDQALLIYLGSIFFLSTCFSACAPVFSELQDARTVGENRLELTPSGSSVNYREEGDKELIQNHMGLQVAYGLTPKVDLRLRYEYIWFKGFDLFDGIEDGISVIAIGPKFSLLENRIAFSWPVGKAIGKNAEGSYWESHPSLIFTIPAVKDKFDINLAPKYLMIFGDEYSDLMAFNLGFSLSNNLNRWCIRPEYGVLFSPDDLEGHYYHFSLGFSYAFGK